MLLKNLITLRRCILWTALSYFSPATGQKPDTLPKLALSGYIETYFLYDIETPSDHQRDPWIYSHNRNNEVNINLAFLKASHSSEKTRANLAFMTGTYANANLAQEPGVLRNIFEANAGVKISQKHNLWIDMGVMPSHIGFESAIGMDCMNLTRSILADNSPYFESGAKITYITPSNRWLFSGMYLNGWQRIQRPDGYSTPSFGHQIQWKPKDGWIINSSSFLGTDTPDRLRKMRYFHNFYLQGKIKTEWTFVLGIDNGLQQQNANEGLTNGPYHHWWSPVFIIQNQLSKRLRAAVRFEHYNDRNGVIISDRLGNGFEASGYSANLDVQISENALWRIEARQTSGTSLSQTYFTTALMIRW